MREKVWKYFRQVVFLAGVLLFALGRGSVSALAGETDREDLSVYETDNYCVTFSVSDGWQDGRKAVVFIENRGVSTIHNWSLAFKMQGGIAEIWDAKVCAQAGDFYVIKNAGYNQDILPGDTVSFGMISEGEERFPLPQSFLIPMRTAEVDCSSYKVEVTENFNWPEGYSGSIIITNLSDREIDDWELEIAFGTEITSIWNGSILSSEGDTYKIASSTYHQNIQPGESISVGFLGKKCSDTTEETEYHLTEVMTAEVTDNIVSKEIFEGIIPLTGNYFISPLYTMGDNIAAYLVQYYDEAGKGCSYIIVNNAVNPEDRYYIEFGYGDAPVIAGLRTAYLENGGDDTYRVLYLGGYEYYIKDASGIYGIKDGGLCKLEEEEIQYFSGVTAGTQYYNEGETLTYGDILAKEIGYSSCEKKIDTTPSTIYITMEDAAEEYFRKEHKRITSHCTPTAATNMLIYLSRRFSEFSVTKENFFEVFMKFYEEMGTNVNQEGTTGDVRPAYIEVLKWLGHNNVKTDVFPLLTWDKAKECIKRGPVHLELINSQIYWNTATCGDINENYYGHSVLGVGYISFSHSSGWTSKYFQIVDGWREREGEPADYRYVNFSLGIKKIILIVIEPGILGSPYPTPTPPEN